MLRELRIRNLAIVEDVTLAFEDGFTVLTGETGAGKSILTDGLSLALGERADREQVRAGQAEARVEALFDVAKLPEVRELLVELEVPFEEEELVLRRIVTATGKSRCAVNGSPVPLAQLKRIGDLLVDLHGQHEHQLLLDPAQHLSFVDAFGGLLEARSAVRQAFRTWTWLGAELEAARAGLRGRSERLDLLAFQIEEIEAVKPESGEDVRLAAERLRLANVQKLAEAYNRAHDALMGDGGAQERLGEALAALRTAAEWDSAGAGASAEAIHHLLEMFRDEGNNLRGLIDRLESDPARLEAVEERLDRIERLKRKYGGSVEGVLKHLAAARGEANGLASSDEAVAALEKKLEEARVELSRRAVELSDDRARAAAKFAELVADELRELAMEGADFGVRTSQQDDSGGPVEMEGNRFATTGEGIDRLEFYLAPNVGEGTRPLKAIASGGELSRLMLALKAVLASVDRVGTLVFDEIDAGIGGRVAEVVGRKLKKIGKERQVVCITHLPQIAAKAAAHAVVRKVVNEGHTKVETEVVTGKPRLKELARMLAGEEITPTALKHAQSLLDDA